MSYRSPLNWRRQLFYFARLTHIYTSTFLLALVVFFCLTGVTLNHRWYGDSDHRLEEFPLDVAQLREWQLLPGESWQPNLNRIRNFIMEKWQFPPPHSIDMDAEIFEILLDFKVPAGFASVTIVSEERLMLLEIEQGSAIGVLNDLHKGRHSGKIWFWLLDISAVLIAIFALSGLLILYQGKRHRRDGTLLVVGGLITPLIIFLLYVPYL
ncbi:MAG: PepSY-associated TM helix domain-containing protein [Cellvibrionaceae bacterium]|nr:PepSY-associated TM helix domain-containing protein [Cellvibrionaceae bacterium]